MKQTFDIAIVGATGAVGTEIINYLENHSSLEIDNLYLLASKHSAGQKLNFKNKEYSVIELNETFFDNHHIDIAFFSAGGATSLKYAKHAAKSCLVIDNTSAFRMEEGTPLVVPEINGDIIEGMENGLIANPNCSTIQLVHILDALHSFGIDRVDVSTYQAVSGAGNRAIDDLVEDMRAFFTFTLDKRERNVMSDQIGLNLIPSIGTLTDNGFTDEELKMTNESKKILRDDNIKVVGTCVRVPVIKAHSESVTIEFKQDIDLKLIKKALSSKPHIVLSEDDKYPMPVNAENTDITYVGRVRQDIYNKKKLLCFIVADNIRVGAATNSVKIAEVWQKTI